MNQILLKLGFDDMLVLDVILDCHGKMSARRPDHADKMAAAQAAELLYRIKRASCLNFPRAKAFSVSLSEAYFMDHVLGQYMNSALSNNHFAASRIAAIQMQLQPKLP